jgi:hypothetical protein
VSATGAKGALVEVGSSPKFAANLFEWAKSDSPPSGEKEESRRSQARTDTKIEESGRDAGREASRLSTVKEEPHNELNPLFVLRAHKGIFCLEALYGDEDQPEN